METVELNLYLMTEQDIIVISPKHLLLNFIQDDKRAQPSVIVSCFPNSNDKQLLILLLAPYSFLQAAPTCKMSSPD